jgi:hypothetical protein
VISGKNGEFWRGEGWFDGSTLQRFRLQKKEMPAALISHDPREDGLNEFQVVG